MHEAIRETAEWLKQVVTGYFQYHAVPTNGSASRPSAITSSISGGVRSGGAARSTRMTWQRIGKLADDWLPNRASFIPGQTNASPSNTQGGSRMRESRTYGSVRGVRSNAHPYRNP